MMFFSFEFCARKTHVIFEHVSILARERRTRNLICISGQVRLFSRGFGVDLIFLFPETSGW